MEKTGSGIRGVEEPCGGQDRESVEPDRSDRFGSDLNQISDSKTDSSKKIPRVHHHAEVDIFGQIYHIISEEESEHVERLARYLNDKMSEVARNNEGISTLRIAIMAALNIADEYHRLKLQCSDLAEKGDRMLILLNRAIEE